MARPDKLTKERADKIIELVRAGNFKTTAARRSGVWPSTLEDWVRRGKREGKGKFYEFYRALDAADAEAEVNAVDKWITHQDKSPEALKEFLRRRFPHWNVPDRRETEVSVREDTNKDVIEARVQQFFEELKRRQIKVED